MSRQERTFLNGSIFDQDFMQTRITSSRISAKERLFGHIIGPGMVYTFYTVVLGLRELYYMDILKINEAFGNDFTYLIMTVVTTIIGLVTGILVNYITERTVCRAGRFRPYVLIGTWLMAISGFAMFWTPFASGSAGQLVWLYLANILYYCVAIPLWNQKDLMVSVTSRNLLERNNVTTLRGAITNMMAGIFVSLGIIGFVYPTILQKDLSGRSWLLVIGIFSVTAAAFSLVEYFYTRERITEDIQKSVGAGQVSMAATISLKQQFKNLFSSKYYRMGVIVTAGMLFVSNMQGGNARVNMITYILGGNDQNGLQMMYLMIAMQPMAIGAVVVPILANKFGARKIVSISSIITAAGVGIALINPYNFGIAVIGGLVFSCGIFAVSNMYPVFPQQANDMLEYDHGYRPEGTMGYGIITTGITAILSPVGALYETGLSMNGYVAGAMTQNAAVNRWILFAYYGSYVIAAVLMFVICIFFDAEKKMPDVHRQIKEREKEAAKARGEVYVDPEEEERLEKEKAQAELEAARIEELKKKCAKKGLDFETENQKYLNKKQGKKKK